MSTITRAQELLEQLIAFPTVSTDSNLDMITFIADHLTALGARVNVFHDPTGSKANLFATLGPEGDGGIVLSGHSDVVPVADQVWSSDPFTLREADGLLYGRGTCDMKGFIACTLATAERYATLTLTRPIHFAFTHDEETGCIGARALIDALQKQGLRPAIAIIGEPTEMRIIEGHKGCCEYTTSFTGLAGHSSRPELGVNAAEYAVRYVSKLLELRHTLTSRAPSNSRFVPPHTTLNVGKLSGGVAHNVIVGKAEVEWEFRPVQNSDYDFVKSEMKNYAETVLLPAMQAVHPEANITMETKGEVAGLTPMDDNEARDLCAALTGENGADVVAFGTEAGLFQTLGLSAVVCGPGSIDQAHKPDEFIAKSQLEACLKMLKSLGQKTSA
ncbi:acetylornithine deacetylase [Lentibacter algarum]|uniref:acetylornithine deacetylase n=1 Tax=Lentibacter algarum TaxID=576131 RepID=UPI001C06737A|nr:acetylornithine deacetylase [Lentibacter algarum]MBU2980431.1 acetylornithine deacetylase [Lentibacter algarum]